MEKLTSCDKQSLIAFVRHFSYATPMQAVACWMAFSETELKRAALNASLERLCAAGFLCFSDGEFVLSDKTALTARARLWKGENWEKDLLADLDAAEISPESISDREYVTEDDYKEGSMYACGIKKALSRGRKRVSGIARKRLTASAIMCVISLLVGVLCAFLAVQSALKGDYDNTFAAIGSFLFLPFAILSGAYSIFLLILRKNAHKEAGEEKQEKMNKRGKVLRRTVAVLCAISCLVHIWFFSVLIPFAWYHVFGLIFALGLTVLLGWLYFYTKPSKSKPKIKNYNVECVFITRNSRFYLNGVDIFSDENRAPQPKFSVAVNVFGNLKKADVYSVNGKTSTFYVAVSRFDGMTAIGFLRTRERNLLLFSDPLRESDEEKNAKEERELLQGFARESAAAENGDFRYSPDFLLRGFVCCQKGRYCVRLSSPFFLLPDEKQFLPPEESGIEAIRPEPQQKDVIAWNTVTEEFFDQAENAEKYLSLVLEEADTDGIYANAPID